VIFFGALAAWQGIDVLLAATSRLEWPSDVALVVLGEGVGRTTVERAAASNPRVQYLGVWPYRDVAGAVAHSIAGLAPKTGGPERTVIGLSPLKMYETVSCGTPLIATDMPSQADFVRGIGCGIVVPQEDPQALAQAVATLAGNDALARAMGMRGRAAVVAEHSWERRAGETLSVIERVRASVSS
jgi:glycosyltransferase involved in cell wall biosynthesis